MPIRSSKIEFNALKKMCNTLNIKFIESGSEINRIRKIKNESDNVRLPLHFVDISEEINLKLSRDNSIKKYFNILYRNKIITIDQKMLEFAFTYIELDKKHRLEGIYLIEEILKRTAKNLTHLTHNDLSFFFKEIVKQKEYFEQYKRLKERVVWSKLKDETKTEY